MKDTSNPQGLSRRAFLLLSLRAAAAVSLGAGLLRLPRPALAAQLPPPSPLMNPIDLEELVAPALSGCPTALRLVRDTVRILDVRDPEAFAAGHCLSAVNLPVEQLSADIDGVPGQLIAHDQARQVLGAAGVHPDLETVVYGDEGNLWASRLYWVLTRLGHRNVRLLDGGWTSWLAAERPVGTEAGPGPDTTRFDAEPDPAVEVDAAWVEAHLDDPTVVFLDARDEAAYLRGHLPGARSVPWRDSVSWPDEHLRSLPELLTRFRDAGATPDLTIVSYCQLGVLSAHNFFVLRYLGYPDVRLYDGSWADWSKDPERPVESGAG